MPMTSPWLSLKRGSVGAPMRHAKCALLLVALLSPGTEAKSADGVLWSDRDNRLISAVREAADRLLKDRLTRCLPSQPASKASAEPPPARYDAVASQVNRMFDADQNARLLYQMSGYEPGSLAHVIARNVDRANLPKIEAIVHDHGILVPSEVGADVSEKFMTLVIHADGDRDFQEKVVSIAEHGNFSAADANSFAPALTIIKGREGYHRETPVAVPYPAPGASEQGSGPSCMRSIFSEWYPWYVQEHLEPSLIAKARSGVQ